MICRLCLEHILHVAAATSLFDSANNTETQAAKMIAKYLHLEIRQDDTISTSICEDCAKHVLDFHNFRVFIDQKQGTLQHAAEFFEIKSDVELQIEAAEEQSSDEVKRDVLLMSIEDVPSSKEYHSDREELSTTEVNTAYVDGKDNIDADTAKSSEDDTPLVKLKSQCKIITKAKRHSKAKTKKKCQQSAAIAACKTREIIKVNHNIITDFMQINCDLCNSMAMKSFDDLRKHFKLVHKSSKAYVKCCNRKLYMPCKLVEHINWHQNPDMFKCDICGKQLRDKKNLRIHKNTLHGGNKAAATTYTCNVCSKEFRHPKSLDNHTIMHRMKKTHKCELCEKSFPTETRLQKHIQIIHENLCSHICDYCGKNFKSKQYLEKHILCHQGVAAQEPPVECDICGKWFKSKNSLRLHRPIHLERDIKCEQCNRVCSSRDALRSHKKYMHKLQNIYQCTFCDKSFKLAKSLEEHTAIHTGTQLYKCPHCDWECRSQSNMYSHIKRDHAEEWTRLKMARFSNPNGNIKL